MVLLLQPARNRIFCTRCNLSMSLVVEEITFDDAVPQQSVAVHTDAMVVCQASGNPAPQVSWRFKGRRLTDSKCTSVKSSLYNCNLVNRAVLQSTVRCLQPSCSEHRHQQWRVIVKNSGGQKAWARSGEGKFKKTV